MIRIDLQKANDFLKVSNLFKSNTDDTDLTDFHGSVRIRVIRAIRVLSQYRS